VSGNAISVNCIIAQPLDAVDAHKNVLKEKTDNKTSATYRYVPVHMYRSCIDFSFRIMVVCS